MSPLPGISGLRSDAPRFAPQQLYFGQVGPGVIPQAPRYGFQHQQLSGLQPGIPSNFVVPFHLQWQGQPGGQQRGGSRRGGNSQQLQQQQRNSNQGLNRYMINQRNGVNPSLAAQSLMGPVMPLPLDASTVMEIPLAVPLSCSTLASALASASPENQCLMLGEQLYPLVERIEHTHARKVAGMLLEKDQTEVLHLIESPDALKKKVAEAMEVLRLASSGPDIGNQLGSLS